MDGRGGQSGFTLVEVPIALVILVVGVMAVVGSQAMASRMVGVGRHSTTLASIGTARMEWLRGLASATAPPCLDTRFADGTAVTDRIGQRWEVASAGSVRRIRLALDHPEAGGVAWDTLHTAILCR